jgi:hypothetical protein
MATGLREAVEKRLVASQPLTPSLRLAFPSSESRKA